MTSSYHVSKGRKMGLPAVGEGDELTDFSEASVVSSELIKLT